VANSYALGLKVLRRLCEEQSPLKWNKDKLTAQLFKADEVQVFEYVQKHVLQYHQLPQIVTLEQAFPEIGQIQTPEPSGYYVHKLETGFYHQTINQANLDSQALLKSDPDQVVEAGAILSKALEVIKTQQYRTKLIDVGVELPKMILDAYHHTYETLNCAFGWPALDTQGGLAPGEVASFVGRPALGKTFFMLYCALYNWLLGRNVLFVSMEMAPLPLGQRIAAMYAHTPMTQLKNSSYSTFGKSPTYQKFLKGLEGISNEKSKFYVIDGNLAASAEDVFIMANMLECPVVYIDGAYLLRHKNAKLDRFQRAGENVELIKRYTTDDMSSAVASWQFNRVASQKNAKKAGSADLEDIGSSDAIGQISSVVCGLFEEEGVETMKKRLIRILKGRNGESGQLAVNWDFQNMDFQQIQGETSGPLPEKML
jgi:replicative DNA helicase